MWAFIATEVPLFTQLLPLTGCSMARPSGAILAPLRQILSC
jgi:hypothetical protein